ncbi:MAG TPA: GatB/YqeY domain-containing protein [Candidatus Paceibacterota bacterium]
MSLHQQLKGELKNAMRAKDTVRLTTIRSLLTAFTNELVANRQKPDGEVTDETALAVITRASKQRKDSIDQFVRGNREDLAEVERKELAIIESYLPEMMKKEDVLKVAQAKKAELGIDDPTKKGVLMGAIMKELKGKADGNTVKEVVEGLF